MGKLYIGSANDLDCFDNFISLLLQFFLEILRNGKHRRAAERVSGMHTHRVNIFNEADGNHLVFAVADNFQFQLFPTKYRFLDQNLANQAGADATADHCFQFIHIVNESAASAAHGIGRTDYHRITQLLRNLNGLLYRIGRFRARHINAQLIHGVLKFNAVFALFNCLDLDSNDLHIIFVQDTCLI